MYAFYLISLLGGCPDNKIVDEGKGLGKEEGHFGKYGGTQTA